MNSENIVFVEDDADDIFLLKMACKKAGMTGSANFLENGRRAVEFFKPKLPLRENRSKPFLIFLDLNMPEMNGFEFLKWLRQEAAVSSVPVIILSTSENPMDIAKAYDVGANAYLVKANSIDDLTSLISVSLQFWTRLNRQV